MFAAIYKIVVRSKSFSDFCCFFFYPQILFTFVLAHSQTFVVIRKFRRNWMYCSVWSFSAETLAHKTGRWRHIVIGKLYRHRQRLHRQITCELNAYVRTYVYHQMMTLSLRHSTHTHTYSTRFIIITGIRSMRIFATTNDGLTKQ